MRLELLYKGIKVDMETFKMIIDYKSNKKRIKKEDVLALISLIDLRGKHNKKEVIEILSKYGELK